MGIAAEILTRLRADASQFNSEIGNAVGSTRKLQESNSTLSKIGGAMFLALGAAAVGFVGESIKAATEFEGAHTRLVTSIKNVGEAYDTQKSSVEGVDSKMRLLGFTDTETETSLSRLIPVTHSTKAAIDLMGVAADVAAGRHIGLEQVTQLLVRAESGHATVLGRLGVQMHDTSGHALSAEQAIAKLGDQFKGQAAAQADTFGGKIKVVEAELDHFAVIVGEAVIPIIEKLAGVFSSVADFFAHNTTAVIAFGTALAAIALPPLLAFTSDKIIGGFNLVSNGFEFIGNAAGRAVDGIANMASSVSVWVQGADSATDISVRAGGEMKKMAGSAGLSSSALKAMGQDGKVASGVLGGVATAATGVDVAAGAAAEGGILAFATSTAGITLGVSLAIGAMAGLALALGVFDSSESKAQMEGDKLGKQLVLTALAAGDVVQQHDAATKSLNELSRAIKFNNKDMQANVEAMNAAGRANQNTGAATEAQIKRQSVLQANSERLNREYDRTKDLLDKLDPRYKQEELSREVAVKSVKKLSDALGFQVLTQGLSSKQIQVLSAAMVQLTGDTNAFTLQVAQGAGVTAATFVAIGKEVTKFSKTIGSALEGSTNPFSAFSKNLTVSYGDFKNFIDTSLTQAQNWSTKFQSLMSQGINKGWMDEIAKAGPAALPLLDNLQQLIDERGIAAVNDEKDQLIAINQQLTDAYAAQVLATATVAAEAKGAVDAYTADLATTGTAHLTEFANNGDTQMKKFAYAMLVNLSNARADTDAKTAQMAGSFEQTRGALALGETQVYKFGAAINGLPPEKPIHVSVHTDQGALDALERRLDALRDQTWFINVAIAGNASSPFGSDRGIKKNIVPVRV